MYISYGGDCMLEGSWFSGRLNVLKGCFRLLKAGVWTFWTLERFCLWIVLPSWPPDSYTWYLSPSLVYIREDFSSVSALRPFLICESLLRLEPMVLTLVLMSHFFPTALLHNSGELFRWRGAVSHSHKCLPPCKVMTQLSFEPEPAAQ